MGRVRPIIFVLGPSGVGKSYLSKGLEQDYSFLYVQIDTDDKRKSFEANGFPSEWDKGVHRVDPAHLVTVVRSRLAVEHAGAVVSFPTVHVFTPEKLVEAAQLGVTPVVLWGKQEDCVQAAEKRIKRKGMTFNLPRYEQLNGPAFRAYGRPEYDGFRVEAFQPDGSRCPRGEWLARIMERTAG
jgi:hypothetical protein